jgi:very-short-patch-repair endonuclease
MFEQENKSGINSSAAKVKLWEYLKDNKLFNLPFRIEYPMGKIGADFYCDPLRLAIRIEEDDQELKRQRQNVSGEGSSIPDIKVLRFEETDIEFSIEEVIESIKWECALRHLKLESKLQEQKPK